MRFPRRVGILLHPTSLPSGYGIGDLGPNAYKFIDWLVAAGQRLWQVLPLGPTGYGDSPYQCFSAFAGNPLLISPERLQEQGWLTADDLLLIPPFSEERVDYSAVSDYKQGLFRKAYERWATLPHPDFERWAATQVWLSDYALFIALKGHFGGGAWLDWPDGVKSRDRATLARYRHELAEEIVYQQFLQYQFAQQWITLRAYARRRGVALIGDMPIFIAHDSADAWANRDLFTLRDDGTLEVQAGVPPDYFSETGQLWGNPLYRWEVMARDGYAWWVARFRAILNLVDRVRLDHFLGFENFWEVPGQDLTALNGQWRKGPGSNFFDAVREALGDLPILAEDLGVVTPEVAALRDRYDFPGMRIMQFGFSADLISAFLPHNYIQNTVAYTGSHDNDTTRGWFEALDETTQARVCAYLNCTPATAVAGMVRAIIASVADTAIVPLQDVLNLGSEARMNFPGLLGGWWQWRTPADAFTLERAVDLATLAGLYGRLE